MRDAQNIREVAALGVNIIGLIFYPKSPRYVQSISSDAGIIPDYNGLTPYPLPEGEGSKMLDKQQKAEETEGEARNKQSESAHSKSAQSESPFNKVTTPLSFGEGHGGEAVIIRNNPCIRRDALYISRTFGVEDQTDEVHA